MTTRTQTREKPGALVAWVAHICEVGTQELTPIQAVGQINFTHPTKGPILASPEGIMVRGVFRKEVGTASEIYLAFKAGYEGEASCPNSQQPYFDEGKRRRELL